MTPKTMPDAKAPGTDEDAEEDYYREHFVVVGGDARLVPKADAGRGMSEPRMAGGIGRPPAGIGQRRGLAAPGDGSDPHFFQRAPGPARLVRLPAPEKVRLRGGKTATVTHRCRWFLDRVEGVSRREAGKRINDVLLDPAGWVRAGVDFRRTNDRNAADALVSIVAPGTTRCGPSAAGCASWGQGLPLAEVEADLIGEEGAFRMVLAMELPGHLAFAMDDGYINHGDYRGSLGSWESAAMFGFRPSDAEIEGAKQWLAGGTPPEFVHEHG